MFRIIHNFLSKDELAEIKEYLTEAEFVDGKKTAAGLAKKAKNNLQLEIKSNTEFIKRISNLVSSKPIFQLYTLIEKMAPIVVGKYTDTMTYGSHMDNIYIGNVRTDLSFTIFLNDPKTYEGGELIVETEIGEKAIKLPAGSIVIYPSTKLHRVSPVISGERLVIVSWVQSKVKDLQKREILIDMRNIVEKTKEKNTDSESLHLIKVFYKLQHMWYS